MSLVALNRLAGRLGYMSPLPVLINAAPVNMSLSLDGNVECGTYLNGDIIVHENAQIMRQSRLIGLIEISKNVKIGRASKVSGCVTIGRYTSLNGHNYVDGEVRIGQFCAIAPRTAIWARNHDMNEWAVQHRFRSDLGIDWSTEEAPVEVGSDVWMGFGSMVLPDVKIGHGACVGAKSVVTRDVKPYEIVAGTPAEHLGWRFDAPVRNKLLETEWWNWNLDKIREEVDHLREIINK